MDYYRSLKPLLFHIDPETAHGMGIRAMKMGMVPPAPSINDKALEVALWGLKFSNPIGLSAGFDKNAEVIGPALKLGFGFVEAGTVTPKPQAGNPRPRVFRDPANEAVINRMGFPNEGASVFKRNLERFLRQSQKPSGIIGLNIGMNKDQADPASDYTALVRLLGPMADYLTVNISSPNTPGLRDLQKREPLTALLNAIMETRRETCPDKQPPLLVKLAPDLTMEQQEELAGTLMDCKVDGVILTNTTLDRPDYLSPDFREQKGGLSGKPVREKSTALIRNFYKLTDGKLPIIGVGGISSGADAYEKIKAGASLVQIYSGMIFKGPGLAYAANTELLKLLRADGYTTINEAVGADHK